MESFLKKFKSTFPSTLCTVLYGFGGWGVIHTRDCYCHTAKLSKVQSTGLNQTHIFSVIVFPFIVNRKKYVPGGRGNLRRFILHSNIGIIGIMLCVCEKLECKYLWYGLGRSKTIQVLFWMFDRLEIADLMHKLMQIHSIF